MKPSFAFQWHITDACDQRCKHCYIFSGHNQKPLNVMPLEDLRKVFANCEDFCERFGRAPYFHITGGDPLLHPDFWALADMLKAKGYPFGILGNPFHLSPEVCRRLKEAGCRKYQLSLDGLRETHDWFRKPGSFDATLAAIPLLQAAGIHAIIMTTVSGRNVREIPELVRTVVEHNADVFAFARYCATPEEPLENTLSPADYRELLVTCDRLFRSYEAQHCNTYFARKDHLWTLLDYEEGRFTLPSNAQPGKIYGGCNCGNAHLTILPSGEVYACRRFESPIGNALRDSLVDLWTAPRMEAFRDYPRFSKCSKCELLPYCRGCPAVAFGATGSFYGPDPQCWKEIPPEDSGAPRPKPPQAQGA